MRNYKIQLFVILGLTINTLSGCALMAETFDKNKGELEVTEMTETNKESQFYAVSSAIPLGIIEVNSSNIHFGVPLNLKYHNCRFGDADFNFNYPLKFTDINALSIDESQLPREVSKLQMNLVYTYPILNFYKQRKRVTIDLGKIGPTSYYGIVPAQCLNSVGLRGGFTKDFIETRTHMHNDNLNATYEDITLFTYEDAIVRQSTNSLKVGISFQQYINLQLNGLGGGNSFSGKRTTLFNVYFDVKFLLSPTIDPVYSRYTAYEPGTYTIIAENDGPFDISTVLPLRKLGLNFGLEFQNFMGKKHMQFITQGFEVGMRPGYFESSIQSGYLCYFAKIGLGKVLK